MLALFTCGEVLLRMFAGSCFLLSAGLFVGLLVGSLKKLSSFGLINLGGSFCCLRGAEID